MPNGSIATIPEKCLTSLKVAGNELIQLGEPRNTLALSEIDVGNNCATARDQHGRQLHFFGRGARTPTPLPDFSLRLPTKISASTPFEDTDCARWLTHAAETDHPATPEQIASAWQYISAIQEEDPLSDHPGLRRPQLGALYAIRSHWTVSTDPATVVLPTGTGKTDTMIAALVSEQCAHLLIIVPSDALRTQIATKFERLGYITEFGFANSALPLPRVLRLRRRILTSGDMRQTVSESNVIVATDAILRSCTDNALQTLADSCTHVFIDEAHHLGAPSWKRIRSYFSALPVIQFTATPFRNDGERISGTIIYNYPLSLAQEHEYFRRIDLITVEDHDEATADTAIAHSAVERLRRDLSNGHDHLLLARTNRKSKCHNLEQIYSTVAPDLQPVSIHSGISSTHARDAIQRLRGRQSRVLICVDMFGEGFDMPQLKIAAMHETHKSLPVTLQFVGRFTRSADGVGDASVVVNRADPQANTDVAALYAEDANWNTLLRRGSETRIEREKSFEELIQSFEGQLPEEVPLWNLRPTFSTILYSTSTAAWDPEAPPRVLPRTEACWHAISRSWNMTVTVFARQERVKWGKYENIHDWRWILVVTHWDPEHKLLFLHSSDYDAVHPKRIANEILHGCADLVNGPRVYRVFHPIERPMVRNLGASKVGTVRFTMYFGPDVTTGLSQIEKSESALTNVFGWGYEYGERVTRGCSVRKGKIWSAYSGALLDWREWCRHTGTLVMDDSIAETDVERDFLKPEEISAFPNLHPVAVDWGENLIRETEDRIAIRFDGVEFRLSDVDIRLTDNSAGAPVTFSVESPDHSAHFRIDLHSDRKHTTCTYTHLSGPEVYIRKGSGEYKALAEWAERDPIVVMYADGSFSYSQFFVHASCNGTYDRELLTGIEWPSVDITVESQGRRRRTDSIQYLAAERIRDEFDLIFDDDAAGEAADLVCIRSTGHEGMTVRLVHCKYSSELSPGSRVSDLYEVCGQAQKCIRWKHSGFSRLAEHMRRRNAKWTKIGATRFIVGDTGLLRQLERRSRQERVWFEVEIAQPGLSKEKATEPVLSLLGSTDLYLKKTMDCHLKVLCSA